MKIAVYGANGYQGRLVTAELARRGAEVVMVGRSQARLEEAASALGLANCERRSADLSDGESLRAAVSDCDVVVNCAGPFTLSGDAVARAALAAGSDYVDTSGEQPFIKHLFDTLGAEAEAAGSTVVPGTTDGCLTADLIVDLTAREVAPADAITIAHRLVGDSASRGSLRSALASLDSLKAGGLTFANGDWRQASEPSESSLTFPGDAEPSQLIQLAAPEIVTVPRHVAAERVESFTDVHLVAALTAVTPELVEAMPDGPDEDARYAGRFMIVAEVTGQDGRRARGVVEGNDTYGTTAVIASETAIRLAQGAGHPGVRAAAEVFDPGEFFAALEERGTRSSVEVLAKA